MKKMIKNIPYLGPFIKKAIMKLSSPQEFNGSKDYWEERYARGGHSGGGSYDRLAEFKAEILNKFVKENEIASVIEFGSGDGNQLKLAEYPRYTGYDVSSTVVEKCKKEFADDSSKKFFLAQSYDGEKADLAMSLDVIYHLVEDSVYENYMEKLFSASDRYVVVYSSNTDDNSSNPSPHVKHRRFTDWVRRNKKNWELIEHIPNRYPYDPSSGDYVNCSFADFYTFKKLK